MVAAATMSLPERAREGRNYDYRYVWIRDQCYAGQAVAKLRAQRRARRRGALRRQRRLLEDGSHLRPAYTADRRRRPGRAPARPARLPRVRTTS